MLGSGGQDSALPTAAEIHPRLRVNRRNLREQRHPTLWRAARGSCDFGGYEGELVVRGDSDGQVGARAVLAALAAARKQNDCADGRRIHHRRSKVFVGA